MKKLLLLLLCMSLAVPVAAQLPSGEDILRKIDENMVIEQAVRLSTMVIHGRSGTRTVTSKSWIRGTDKAFVEYLSPPREAGKKMLKLEDKIWTYTPEPTDRIITISGHLLRQSVMGSDLSYEDITQNDKLYELYDVVVEGEEELQGQVCTVLSLTAKEKGLTYHFRKMWVDTEHWLPVKEEWYAKSKKLLKTFEVLEIFQVEGRWFPKKMRFKDVLSRGEGTEFITESIDFNADVPEYMFTKAALRK